VNTTNEGFIVAWYAIDNNYMFRPSGGHHQVFTSFEEKRKAICYIYFGAEISDRLFLSYYQIFFNGKTFFTF
jgi:hypothetical protein